MLLFNTPPAEIARIHRALVESLKDKALRSVIDREFPLAEAPAAHRAVMEGRSKGQIVLVP